MTTADPTLASTSILPLDVRGLRYEADGVNLIKDISFTLESGTRTIILGHNGSGKSLLLRLCHGLIAPTGGEIAWTGGADDPARHQAMVFQRPVMLRRTAAENVGYALRMRGVPRAERRRQVVDALKQTRLYRHADRQARTLSFGEQQRLALARAWAIKPDVLFLDEPTASLDPAVTQSIEELINRIHDAGTKIVMSTHDLGQARRLADEILFLHRGRLVTHAPTDEIFNDPADEAVRAFIAGELFW